MQEKKAVLEPERIYHIYNRANGSELLYRSDENYQYFLRKYSSYISPIAETYCYCLMPNHFHFLLKIKPETDLIQFLEDKYSKLSDKPDTKNKTRLLELLISQQFSNFFNAYSKAYNKQYGRMGSLFMHTYKRKLVVDDTYFRKLVHYIHYNPVKAGKCAAPDNWKFSSYNKIISSDYSMLNIGGVIDKFSDVDNFIYCHTNPTGETGVDF